MQSPLMFLCMCCGSQQVVEHTVKLQCNRTEYTNDNHGDEYEDKKGMAKF